MTKQALNTKLRYMDLKKAIHNGMCDVGKALQIIRDEKLYLDEYPTWVEFCKQECHMGKSKAYRLIVANSLMESIAMSPIGDSLTNESQVRELAKVPKEKHAAVMKAVEITGKHVTAKAINVAAKVVAKEKPDITVDNEGMPIPPPIVPLWDRRSEIDEVLRGLSRIKCHLEKVWKEKDPLWAHCALDTVTPKLELIYSGLFLCKLHAVCTVCSGRPEMQNGKCRLCKGAGLVSKHLWDIASDNLKAVRRKMVSGVKP